jgi:hypothetical protein
LKLLARDRHSGDHVLLVVVGPADRDDVRDPILADGGKAAQAPLAGQVATDLATYKLG